MPPQKYTIAVPQAELDRLQSQLALTQLPQPIELQNPCSRGAPLSEIRDLVEYWKTKFDWRAQEKKLNALNHFETEVQIAGFERLKVHFLHEKGERKKSVPLLFLHGWPGSFLEVTKVVKALTEGDGKEPSFTVVAPSLVGYGFSEASRKEGFGLDQHAEAYHQLMQQLGYIQYVVQGGDIGHYISRIMVYRYPESVKAQHTNMPSPAEPKADSSIAKEPLTEEDKAALAHTAWQFKESAGYLSMQSTRPMTLGYSLADSPVGLLGWIYEKLHDWTDDYSWTPDEILTWISIYRFCRAGPAAPQQLYVEIMARQPEPVAELTSRYFDTPLGISRFPKELLRFPRSWNKTLGPLVFERYHSKGGHFAAWERPEELVGDLKEMFGRGGGAYGVVEGRDGY